MSWDDQAFAARFRDLIVQVAEGVVDRMRPEERLGKIYSFDVWTKIAQVLFAGETVSNLQPVQMSSNQMPSTTMDTSFDTLAYDAPGDIIRVGGKDKLYCIAFVSGNPQNMGYSVPVGGIVYYPALTIPSIGDSPGWVPCNGQTLDGLANPQYARLFGIIGNTYGGTDITNFVVPNYSGPQIYSGPFTPAYSTASGWSTYTVNLTRIGNVATLQGSVTRTGAGLAAGTDGNIANTDIFTLTDPALRPAGPTGIDSSNTGTLNQFVIFASGLLQVVATPPSAGVGTGDTISFAGTYAIVPPTDSNAMMKL